MLVTFLICDFCGTQNQIHTDEKKIDNVGFEFCFYTLCASDALENKRYNPKYNNLTFCGKECLMEFLKKNINNDGMLKKQDDQ